MKVLVINGPNLNLLGTREPEIYGSDTLEDIIEGLKARFPQATVGDFQSNHEGVLVDRIQQALQEDWDGLVVNLGALSHYSYALRDALNMVQAPVFEVHISHVYAREPFRHHSVISAVCQGLITGFGVMGYSMALYALAEKIKAG